MYEYSLVSITHLLLLNLLGKLLNLPVLQILTEKRDNGVSSTGCHEGDSNCYSMLRTGPGHL